MSSGFYLINKIFVIIFMSEWTFRDYQRPSTDGTKRILVNEILAWTSGLPKRAQARIDTMIITLQAFPVIPPQYISDCGYKDIWEIRAGSGGVEYRPLGCYGPGRRVFTLLIGTIEKDGKIPAGDGASAVHRRKRVIEEGWPTCEHEFT
jgi:hypothetical protein